MALNLGTTGVEAIRVLRGSEHWATFCTALEDAARARLHAALESPVEMRVDATAYARAMHDLWTSVIAVSHDLNPRQAPKLSAKALATTNAKLDELVL